jgi:hypothetical protein
MPQAKNPDPEPAPAAPPADEPEWAASLRATMEALPGKITASITNDDKRGIAEYVHGLFESSGAFIRKDEEEPPEEKDEPNPDDNPTTDDSPQQKDSLARRLLGPH